MTEKDATVGKSDRFWAYHMAREMGPTDAADMIGIDGATLARLCAGFPVSRGTLAIVHIARLLHEGRIIAPEDSAVDAFRWTPGGEA